MVDGDQTAARIGRARAAAVLLVVALVAAACGGGDGGSFGEGLSDGASAEETTTDEATPTPEPQPTATPEPEPTATPEPEPTEPPTPTPEPQPVVEPLPDPAFTAGAAPGGPGFMCAGTRHGMSCLEDGVWTSYTRDNAPIRDWVIDLGICDDSRVITPSLGGVSILEAGVWTELAVEIQDVPACRGDEIWGHDFDLVVRSVAGETTTIPTVEVFPESDFPNLISAIEIAPDGSTWIAGADAVARFANGTWTRWTEGNGFDRRLSPDALDIEVLADGGYRVWISSSSFIASFENDTWTTVEDSFIGARAIDAFDGVAAVPAFQAGFEIVDGTSIIGFGRDEGLSSNTVRDLAVDGQGRLYAATAYGVTVFESGEARTYRVDNSGLIDNDVWSIVVGGMGPQLPADAPEEWAGIAGLALDQAGNPIVGAAVEVCVEDLDDEFEGDSPCALDPYTRTSVTDEDGRFEILSLRAGRYVMSFQLPDATSWTYFVDGSVAVRYSALEPGVVAQIGAITFQTG